MIKPVLFGLAALIFLHSAYANAAALRLALVLSEQAGVYQEYGNALSAQLENKNITLNLVDADKPLPDADLYIAAGMKAAMAVAQIKPAALLVVLVPQEGFARLLQDFPAHNKGGTSSFSAIYLDQPLKRQLDLIRAVLPRAGTIGVIYATQPKELAALRVLATARKFDLNERPVSSASKLPGALQELLISSDVLLALPDAEIYNASMIRNILLATYRHKVPLIGFSPGFVKAGALCAVFSTPEQIAAQSLGIVRKFAEIKVLPAPQYATTFEVSVNEQVAHSLGLNIKNAAQVRSEIGAAP